MIRQRQSTTALGWAVILVVVLVAAACTSSDTPPPGATGSSGTSVGLGSYRATIARTTDGVPHIVGDSLANVVFGQGYASFQDRSCDLADQVVKVRSERARWFGPGDDDANINSDVAWKAIGLRERAERDFPNQPPEERTLVGAFAAGWNQALRDIGVDAINGWCRGAPWVGPISDLDLYTYTRSVTLLASSGRLLDYIAKAAPPTGGATPSTEAPAPGPSPSAGTPAGTAPAEPTTAPTASNGWAIGSEASANGHGLLMANPHFPWEGELRFWEVQLTVPGRFDIYGVQLSGLPGVGIGFTSRFGWTHTVSAGNRFTAYTLSLVPGKPTVYRYGDQERAMTSKPVTVEVAQPDGTTATVTRTMWSSHYGPIINFPGVGWTESMAITYRDANIDNTTFLSQYLEMDQAQDLDQFIAAHEKNQGVPLFNTIAVSDDGRAWYADTSATPNLSPEAQQRYEASLKSNLVAATAAGQGAVVLDGSDPIYEWVDEPGARSPGLVPYARMPKVERRDYVFNANDSYWLVNADHPLEGDYSILHGRPDTPRSPRTRENAVVLEEITGAKVDRAGIESAALRDEGYMARALRAAVVERCTAVTEPVSVPALVDKGTEVLPAASVDIGPACLLLSRWDGIDDLDRRGPVVWREFLSRFDRQDLTDAGALWAQPFDPNRPVDTPSGLADDAQVITNLARSVQVIQAAGVALDAPLSDLQRADRGGRLIPVPGGTNTEGLTNIVGWSTGLGSTREPLPTRPKPVAPQSDLTSAGYPVNVGTSFLMALSFGPDGPDARAILTYGETQDRTSPLFSVQTERFAHKDWRRVLWRQSDQRADPAYHETTVTG